MSFILVMTRRISAMGMLPWLIIPPESIRDRSLGWQAPYKFAGVRATFLAADYGRSTRASSTRFY
jgi:hypothetical protein